MAKTTGPLFSLTASGSLGRVIVYSIWNGISYVRTLVTPSNPRTAAQAVLRSAVGGASKAISAVRTRFFPSYENGSQFYLDAITVTPSGQAWNSYTLKQIIGNSGADFVASHAAFVGLETEDKATYTEAAADAGIPDFILGYGTLETVLKGALLYMMVKFAIEKLGFELSAGTLAIPTEAGLENFIEYMQDDVASE